MVASFSTLSRICLKEFPERADWMLRPPLLLAAVLARLALLERPMSRNVLADLVRLSCKA
jgi:hypothetical protein